MTACTASDSCRILPQTRVGTWLKFAKASPENFSRVPCHRRAYERKRGQPMTIVYLCSRCSPNIRPYHSSAHETYLTFVHQHRNITTNPPPLSPHPNASLAPPQQPCHRRVEPHSNTSSHPWNHSYNQVASFSPPCHPLIQPSRPACSRIPSKCCSAKAKAGR